MNTAEPKTYTLLCDGQQLEGYTIDEVIAQVQSGQIVLAGAQYLDARGEWKPLEKIVNPRLQAMAAQTRAASVQQARNAPGPGLSQKLVAAPAVEEPGSVVALQVIGGLELAGGVVLGLLLGMPVGLVWIVAGTISGVMCFAFARIIALLARIEANTRR